MTTAHIIPVEGSCQYDRDQQPGLAQGSTHTPDTVNAPVQHAQVHQAAHSAKPVTGCGFLQCQKHSCSYWSTGTALPVLLILHGCRAKENLCTSQASLDRQIWLSISFNVYWKPEQLP